MQAEAPSRGIALKIRGLGPIPSFKNRKRIGGLTRWPDGSWSGSPILVTRPDIKARKEEITSAIASQLRSMCPTGAGGTIQECWRRFAIASLPRDDCWQDMEIGAVTTELVPAGEEGCTITIERLG